MEVSTEELVDELRILERLSRLVEARRVVVVGRLLDGWLEGAAHAAAADASEAPDG